MEPIRVAVRVRPLLPGEEEDKSSNAALLCEQDGRISVGTQDRVRGDKQRVECRFDCVWPPHVTQAIVFDFVRPSVEKLLQGFNISVLAYGQTGTGKTHTMLGEGAERCLLAPGAEGRDINEVLQANAPDAGIIPRTVSEIFRMLKMNTSIAVGNGREAGSTLNTANVGFAVRCSYMQIYQDRVYDLLGQPLRRGEDREPLAIREMSRSAVASGAGGAEHTREVEVFVAGLSEFLVFDTPDVLRLIQRGSSNRAVRATEYNAHSSRSHAILLLQVESTVMLPPSEAEVGERTIDKNSNGNDASGRPPTDSEKSCRLCTRRSKMQLVDLAGSERWNVKAGSQPLEDGHARELQAINTSLSALGKCIAALTQAQQSRSQTASEEAPGAQEARRTTRRRKRSKGKKGKSIDTLGTPHIPFRDSPLTRVLQDSLGGSTRTLIIATVSPSIVGRSAAAEETARTLAFADRAKLVMARVHAHETIDDAVRLQRAERQIARLRRDLREARQQQKAGLSQPVKQHSNKGEVHGAEVEQLHTEIVSLRAQLQLRDKRLDRVLLQNEQLQRRLEEGMSNYIASVSSPTAAQSGSSLLGSVTDFAEASPPATTRHLATLSITKQETILSASERAAESESTVSGATEHLISSNTETCSVAAEDVLLPNSIDGARTPLARTARKHGTPPQSAADSTASAQHINDTVADRSSLPMTSGSITSESACGNLESFPSATAGLNISKPLPSVPLDHSRHRTASSQPAPSNSETQSCARLTSPDINVDVDEDIAGVEETVGREQSLVRACASEASEVADISESAEGAGLKLSIQRTELSSASVEIGSQPKEVRREMQQAATDQDQPQPIAAPPWQPARLVITPDSDDGDDAEERSGEGSYASDDFEVDEEVQPIPKLAKKASATAGTFKESGNSSANQSRVRAGILVASTNKPLQSSDSHELSPQQPRSQTQKSQPPAKLRPPAQRPLPMPQGAPPPKPQGAPPPKPQGAPPPKPQGAPPPKPQGAPPPPKPRPPPRRAQPPPRRSPPPLQHSTIVPGPVQLPRRTGPLPPRSLPPRQQQRLPKPAHFAPAPGLISRSDVCERHQLQACTLCNLDQGRSAIPGAGAIAHATHVPYQASGPDLMTRSTSSLPSLPSLSQYGSESARELSYSGAALLPARSTEQIETWRSTQPCQKHQLVSCVLCAQLQESVSQSASTVSNPWPVPPPRPLFPQPVSAVSPAPVKGTDRASAIGASFELAGTKASPPRMSPVHCSPAQAARPDAARGSTRAYACSNGSPTPSTSPWNVDLSESGEAREKSCIDVAVAYAGAAQSQRPGRLDEVDVSTPSRLSAASHQANEGEPSADDIKPARSVAPSDAAILSMANAIAKRQAKQRHEISASSTSKSPAKNIEVELKPVAGTAKPASRSTAKSPKLEPQTPSPYLIEARKKEKATRQARRRVAAKSNLSSLSMARSKTKRTALMRDNKK